MKVVIVGGGTAGWLSACNFALANKLVEKDDNANPIYDITVIESKDIPIIGAGEGSTGLLSEFISKKFSILGVNEFDFIYKSNATLKYGIRFKDWNGVGTQYLSPIQPTDTTIMNVDADLLSMYVHTDSYYNSSFSGFLMGKGYTDFSINKISSKESHTFHFDAKKVGEYLKEIALKNGVKYTNGEIIQLNLDKENGNLRSVNIKENSEKIEADFWIDCSGFARILSKNIGVEWVSYAKYLPVNNAIPYLHQYEKDENILAETLAWAQPNGWMWQIPTQERYGCGYVYSDMFVDELKALDELQNTTGRKIEPIRNIKFDIGRVDKFWEKNVVSIGLSSHFLEPLQATSIHSTLIQLDMLVNHHLRDSNPKSNWEYTSNLYNKQISQMVDDFRDLIQVHYMTDREDTEFWKYCKYELPKLDKVSEIIEISKHRSPSHLDFSMYHGAASWGVWGWTLVGLGILEKNIAEKTLKNFGLYNESKLRVNEIQNQHIPLRTMLTHKDFLKAIWNKELGKR
jgi:tryptophan 6-halogenase